MAYQVLLVHQELDMPDLKESQVTMVDQEKMDFQVHPVHKVHPEQ